MFWSFFYFLSLLDSFFDQSQIKSGMRKADQNIRKGIPVFTVLGSSMVAFLMLKIPKGTKFPWTISQFTPLSSSTSLNMEKKSSSSWLLQLGFSWSLLRLSKMLGYPQKSSCTDTLIKGPVSMPTEA